jgi:hypothetical protein
MVYLHPVGTVNGFRRREGGAPRFLILLDEASLATLASGVGSL